MISNGWRMPSSAEPRMSRLQETNSQWEGIPIGNGPRKNEYLKTSVQTGNDINFFSLEAIVCRDETERWSREMTERLFNAL